jgi:hypothetical protein
MPISLSDLSPLWVHTPFYPTWLMELHPIPNPPHSPTPKQKGHLTFFVLCRLRTHQALQLGPATFPQSWPSSPGTLCREREGGALKEQSLLSEPISTPKIRISRKETRGGGR